LGDMNAMKTTMCTRILM